MKQFTTCAKIKIPACWSCLMTTILVFSMMASILTSQGQVQQKIDSLEKVIRNSKKDTSLIKAMASLSYNYTRISNFNEAMRYADSTIELAGKLRSEEGQAIAYYTKGNLLAEMGNYPAALDNFMISLKFSEKSGIKKTIAKAYDYIGVTYYYIGDYPEALKNCSTALQILEETGFKKEIASAYENIGKIYLKQYKYREAAQMFFAAIKIMEEIGNRNGMAVSYNSLGSLYIEQGNFEEALKMFHAALEIDEENGYKLGILYNYNNIGAVLHRQGKYSESIEMLQLSLKICEEIGDTVSTIDICNNIGYTYTIQDNYKDAEVYFKISLELAKKIEHYEEGITATHDYLAFLFVSQEKFAEAEKHFLAALEVYEKSGIVAKVARQYNRLGKLFFSSADFLKARKYVEEGLSLCLLTENIKGLKYSYHYLYQIDSAEGRFAGALENYKLYTFYRDSLLSEETHQQINRMKIEYETEKKDEEIVLLNKENEIKSLQLSKQKAIRHGLIVGIVLLSLTGFFLFHSFRLRKKLEKQAAIIQERKRISADLHDDVGSGLSRIILISEMVKKIAKTPETRNEAEKIGTISQELSANISEIIWTLNANNDYLENLVAYIRRYAAEYFENSSVALKIITPGNIPHISIGAEKRRNLFYAVKEALHNIIKHADATEAKLRFALGHHVMIITIHDNGKGIPHGELNRFGNGMYNMRNRMTNINGNFIIENKVGTKITLSLPV